MKLLKDTHGMLSLGSVIVIAVIFVVLMFMAYVIFKIKDMLWTAAPGATTTYDYNSSWYAARNITVGFDSAVNFLVIAVIILIVALAIGAFFAIRGSRET